MAQKLYDPTRGFKGFFKNAGADEESDATTPQQCPPGQYWDPQLNACVPVGGNENSTTQPAAYDVGYDTPGVFKVGDEEFRVRNTDFGDSQLSEDGTTGYGGNYVIDENGTIIGAITDDGYFDNGLRKVKIDITPGQKPTQEDLIKNAIGGFISKIPIIGPIISDKIGLTVDEARMKEFWEDKKEFTGAFTGGEGKDYVDATGIIRADGTDFNRDGVVNAEDDLFVAPYESQSANSAPVDATDPNNVTYNGQNFGNDIDAAAAAKNYFDATGNHLDIQQAKDLVASQAAASANATIPNKEIPGIDYEGVVAGEQALFNEQLAKQQQQQTPATDPVTGLTPAGMEKVKVYTALGIPEPVAIEMARKEESVNQTVTAGPKAYSPEASPSWVNPDTVAYADGKYHFGGIAYDNFNQATAAEQAQKIIEADTNLTNIDQGGTQPVITGDVNAAPGTVVGYDPVSGSNITIDDLGGLQISTGGSSVPNANIMNPNENPNDWINNIVNNANSWEPPHVSSNPDYSPYTPVYDDHKDTHTKSTNFTNDSGSGQQHWYSSDHDWSQPTKTKTYDKPASSSSSSNNDNDGGGSSSSSGGGWWWCCSVMVAHGEWSQTREIPFVYRWSDNRPEAWWKPGYAIWGKVVAKYGVDKFQFFRDGMQNYYEDSVRNRNNLNWKGRIFKTILNTGAFICGTIHNKANYNFTIATREQLDKSFGGQK